MFFIIDFTVIHHEFQIAIRHLWYNLTLDEVMNRKRFHHQLFPMLIEFENAYDMASGNIFFLVII